VISTIVINQLDKFSIKLEQLERQLDLYGSRAGHVSSVSRFASRFTTTNCPYTTNLEDNLARVNRQVQHLANAPIWSKASALYALQLQVLQLEASIVEKNEWLEGEAKKLEDFLLFLGEYSTTLEISPAELFELHSYELQEVFQSYNYIEQSKLELAEVVEWIQNISSVAIVVTIVQKRQYFDLRDRFRRIFPSPHKYLADSNFSALHELKDSFENVENYYYYERRGYYCALT
jgi:hypothetical protein